MASASSGHGKKTDIQRIPPGQHLTERFPVLHADGIPRVDPAIWRLTVSGLVGSEVSLSWPELRDLPPVEQLSDLHCVTRWTKLDTRWKGVRARDILTRTRILPEASHTVIHAEGGWTTNLPLAELLRDDVLVAYEYEGEPLTEEHGGPVRLLVPRLYFWKSAKWLTGIELVAEEKLGYWESLGYHPLGDPWLEQRYAAPRAY